MTNLWQASPGSADVHPCHIVPRPEQAHLGKNTFGKEAKDVAPENEHRAANTSQFRFYLMGEIVKNGFKPCCRSPSLPSSPQRQTAKNKFFCLFLDLFEFLIAPVHTGVQWHQGGSPLGPEGQSLGPASLQPRPTPSPACGR